MFKTQREERELLMRPVYKKTTFFMIVSAIFLFLAGCASKEIDTSTLMDDIVFEVIDITSISNNETDVRIKLTNNSPYKIVQNTVLYLLIETSFDSNETPRSASFMANGNQLNIDPKESVELTVSYPSTIFEQESEVPLFISDRVHFVGYFDTLSEHTRFEFIKELN